MLVVLTLVVSFVLGSLPFAHFVGRRVRGIDLRQHGSGNLGATNVFRTLGPWWGVSVFILDFAKGMAAVFLMTLLARSWPDGQAMNVPADLWRIFAGLLASLGHTFSPFVGFKGGKGVATTAGCFLVLAPLPTVFALVVFALVFGLSRIVSLGSICAAAVLPVAVIFFELRSPDFSWTITIFTLLIAALVILRHRSNIKRLQEGNEAVLVAGGRTEEPEPPLLEGEPDE